MIEELWEGAKARLIWLIASATKKNILVISGSDRRSPLRRLEFLPLPSVVDFPSWETLPGEEIAPSPDLVGKRLQVLHSFITIHRPMLFSPRLQAVLQKLPAKKNTQTSDLKCGRKDLLVLFRHLSPIPLRTRLPQMPVVSDKGEYALRGGIVDIFPLSSPDPYRIEFFGDEIDAIRTFDPISQKSIRKVDEFFLPPPLNLP